MIEVTFQFVGGPDWVQRERGDTANKFTTYMLMDDVHALISAAPLRPMLRDLPVVDSVGYVSLQGVESISLPHFGETRGLKAVTFNVSVYFGARLK